MLSRRDFLAAAPAAALPSPEAQQRRPPNIIIFLCDDLGCHDLGCLGARELKTPHIDALAASGVRFTNWYANAPVCGPSRAALMTGRYPIRCGKPGNGGDLPVREQTLAALLKARGYRTGITGKWHLGASPDTVPNARGFDYFFGFHGGCVDYYSHRYYWGSSNKVNHHDLRRDRQEIFENGQYLTESIAREACSFVARNHANPFFLYVPFNAVHYPMHAPDSYMNRFPDLPFERRIYAAMLAAADDAVGAVMAQVRKHGLLDNTLVFFSADNGATRETRAGLNGQPPVAGSNGIFRGYKFSLFDGGMHVPAVMSWPGRIPAGKLNAEVGMHADVLPTICRTVGAPLPTDRTLDGRDIMQMATAGGRSPHEAIFWSSSGQLAVRRGKWKLVRNGATYDGTPAGSEKLKGEDALFLSDLEADPGEKRNRRHDEPALTDELLTLASKWLEDVKRN